MSIESCRCGAAVDTDEDELAYIVTLENYEEIKLDYCLCEYCRDEFVSLMEVKEKTDQFVQDIFDHVSSVGRVDFLADLYEFRRNIEDKINPKKGE